MNEWGSGETFVSFLKARGGRGLRRIEGCLPDLLDTTKSDGQLGSLIEGFSKAHKFGVSKGKLRWDFNALDASLERVPFRWTGGSTHLPTAFPATR